MTDTVPQLTPGHELLTELPSSTRNLSDSLFLSGDDIPDWCLLFEEMLAANTSYKPGRYRRNKKNALQTSNVVESIPNPPQELANDMRLIQALHSYDELREHFNSPDAYQLQSHEIPEHLFDSMIDVDVEDVPAQWILTNYVTQRPEDPDYEQLVALNTQGEGNCFYHAASRILFGVQFRAREVRYRIVREAVKNEALYKDNAYLLLGHVLSDENEINAGSRNFLGAILQHANAGDGPFTADHVKQRYEEHVMNTLQDGCPASLFECYMLCNIMRRPLRVFFPQLATEPTSATQNLIRDHNRTIWPEIQMYRKYRPVHILWTVTSSNQYTPNHFVPVVL